MTGKRPRTLPPRMSKEEQRLGLLIYPPVEQSEGHVRPVTRADCVGGERPCPWVSCRHHLYLDVKPSGSVQLNFPDKEPWEIPQTCALDVADEGGTSLETAGKYLGLTRERARQIEAVAMTKVRRMWTQLDVCDDDDGESGPFR